MTDAHPRLFGALKGTFKVAEGTDLTESTGEVWSAEAGSDEDACKVNVQRRNHTGADHDNSKPCASPEPRV